MFDSVSFLSELCHYTLNVHVVLSLIAVSVPVQIMNGITSSPAHKRFSTGHSGRSVGEEALQYTPAGYSAPWKLLRCEFILIDRVRLCCRFAVPDTPLRPSSQKSHA
jgi:hypothetical protein